MQEEVSHCSGAKEKSRSLSTEKQVTLPPRPRKLESHFFSVLSFPASHWNSAVKIRHAQILKKKPFQDRALRHSSIKQTQCKQQGHRHTQPLHSSTDKDGKAFCKLEALRLMAFACTLVTANSDLLGADS